MPSEKIARLCWNSNYWRSPSGSEGKSADKDSYEFQTGFGHEEWNFDCEKVLDGYVYGFLQQFNNKTDIHRGETFNISFYSIEKIKSNLNRKWWLGKINSVEVITKAASEAVYKRYKKLGWIAEMEVDLRSLGVPLKEFKGTTADIFFNIRFKVNDMKLLGTPLEFETGDPAVPSFYYNLLDKDVDPQLLSKTERAYVFQPGHNPGKSKTTATTKGGKGKRSLFHNEMQTKIYEILAGEHGADNVGTENDLGYQTKVDVVVKNKKEYTFYEIKTSSTAKSAVREAFGQIMEYAYWPNKSRASKLIIVAPQPCSANTKEYLQSIRRKFEIPIYYQEFDNNTGTLKNMA